MVLVAGSGMVVAHKPPGGHILPGGHNTHCEEEEEVGKGVEGNSCREEHQVEGEGQGEAVRVWRESM